jgi:hypothetical protein
MVSTLKAALTAAKPHPDAPTVPRASGRHGVWLCGVVLSMASTVGSGGMPQVTTQRPVILQGTVVDDDSGAAIPGVVVRLVSHAGPQLQTDIWGHFEVALQRGDLQTVEMSKPNYLPTSLSLNVGAQDMTIAVRMPSLGALSGRIGGVNGATVVAIESVPSNVRPRIMRRPANGDGTFRLFGIPPGQYVLGAVDGSSSGREGVGLDLYPSDVAPQMFEVRAGEISQGLDWHVTPNGAVELVGSIIQQNMSVPRRFAVGILSARHPWIRLAGRTVPSSSTFTFDNVEYGTYDILASELSARRDRFVGRIRVDLQPGTLTKNVAVEVKPAASPVLMLQLLTPERSECASGIELTLEPAEQWPTTFDRIHITNVAVNEPISLAGLAPTLYFVTAQSDRGCASSGVDAIDATAPNLHLVGVGSLATLFFRPSSVGPDGDARVILLRDITPGRSPSSRARLVTGAEVQRFDNLLPGQYTIREVRAVGGDPWFRGGAADIHVRLGIGEEKSLDVSTGGIR